MSSTSRSSPLRISVLADPDAAVLGQARVHLRRWFADQGLALHDWDVVLTELLVNAMNASDPGDPVEVLFECSEGQFRVGHDNEVVTCEVSNHGTWAMDEGSSWATGEPVPLGFLVHGRAVNDLPNGRGLRIVAALTSGGEVTVTGGKTFVYVWRDI